ncbi:uncharacterized protein BXZ73DRAFT_83358 [Epithele typhae]|uniref:uncharacterized protein n=1 Tax=Epithele typhae TaxID=378194 RepID=UPI002008EB06|nr:uncharacterized protein BXZ73DRAFT_83358 [Epithele typhae]KAH9910643.1 hypothetical protein BXZ73DRAFT_83358 [Epithele typhae]
MNDREGVQCSQMQLPNMRTLIAPATAPPLLGDSHPPFTSVAWLLAKSGGPEPGMPATLPFWVAWSLEHRPSSVTLPDCSQCGLAQRSWASISEAPIALLHPQASLAIHPLPMVGSASFLHVYALGPATQRIWAPLGAYFRTQPQPPLPATASHTKPPKIVIHKPWLQSTLFWWGCATQSLSAASPMPLHHIWTLFATICPLLPLPQLPQWLKVQLAQLTWYSTWVGDPGALGSIPGSAAFFYMWLCYAGLVVTMGIQALHYRIRHSIDVITGAY